MTDAEFAAEYPELVARLAKTPEQRAEDDAAFRAEVEEVEELTAQLVESLPDHRARVEAAVEAAKDPYVTDAVTGWECAAGASLIAEAMTPGPGKLGTMHGVIYVCPDHQTAAETLISTTDCTPEIRTAPPGHHWDPWPCGHITAFGPRKGPAFLAALLAPTT